MRMPDLFSGTATSLACTQPADDDCGWLLCGTQVMMGDDTWMQLAQHAFTEAYPYPSFNVHDLHTVDDGVWEVSQLRS